MLETLLTVTYYIYIFNCVTFSITALGFSFREWSSKNFSFRILQIIYLINTFYGLFYFNHNSNNLYLLAISIAMLTSSAALFFYCHYYHKYNQLTLAFCEDQPVHIISNGPYKYVRHPYYLAYLMTFLSIVVINVSIIALVLFLLLFTVYYYAAKFEENKFLNSKLGLEYADYMSRTHMFIPFIF